MSDRFLIPLFGDFEDLWAPSRRQQHRHHHHQQNPWTQLEAIMDLGNRLASMEKELDSAHNHYLGGNRRRAGRGNSGLDFFSPSVESHVHGPQTGAVSSSAGAGEGGNEGKYLMAIPLGGDIKPEDLKVSLKEEDGLKIMSIEAKKEQKSEDGNSRYYYEMSRKFTLPKNVDVTQVKSVLTPEGYLKVEAPLPPPPKQEQIEMKKPTEIPIKMN